MKVCFLGIKGGQPDEGMKNFSNMIYNYVGRFEETTFIDFASIYRPKTLIEIKNFNPDIIHLMVGPTIKGLIILKILGKVFEARTVATALHPQFFTKSTPILRLLSPDLTFVQSSKIGDLLRDRGFNTEFIPSGVDTETFRPQSRAQRSNLRSKLDLPEGELLFLHVGHLKEGRNLHSLKNMVNYGHVCIIGSSSTETDDKLVSELRNTGIQVIDRYIGSIEEYYQAADIYLFPTLNEAHSIQIPLSVLEAMACNCRVLATPFGGLPDLFDSGQGLQFHSDFQEINESDLDFPENTQTREMVEGLDWESIAEFVLQEYDNL